MNMTEFLKKEIYKKLDGGLTVVLPTEESARAVAVSYASSQMRPVLADKCISFDTFSSLFYQEDNKKRPSDDLDRTVFSQWFIDSYCNELEYFYNKDYPEMKEFLPSFVEKMLTDLPEALSGRFKLEKAIFHDLVLIKKHYIEFLERNNLYQLNFEEINKAVDTSSYYLVSPDAFVKEIKLERKLSDVVLNKIKPYKINSDFIVYRQEKEEIRALFLKIRSIIDSSVSMDRIAISTSALERLRPYLDLESKLFAVPLQYVPGVDVLSTLPGAFLLDLSSIVSNGYQISDIKKFFLNPNMPFKDKRAMRDFVEKAVQFSIVASPSAKDDRYSRIYFDSDFSFRDFRYVLDKLFSETDSRKCQIHFQRLLTLLFGEERFIDNKDDNDVFGFVQDRFKVFLNTLSSNEENGYRVEKPVFSLFLKYLKSVKYVSKDKSKGVRVYPFGEGATTPYDYHFLITLNENESKSLLKDAGFLSEYERSGIDDEDVTNGLLETYASFSANLYLSASRETYSSVSLPLVLLKERQIDAHLDSRDSYIAENSEKRDVAEIYPIQKESYINALKSSLKDARRGSFSLPSTESDPWLSFTTVTDYEECHFKYALLNRFRLKNLPAYESVQYDAREIGTRMHSIMERFDRFAPCASPDCLDDFFEQEMRAWQDGKRFFFDENTKTERIENMPAGSAVPSDQVVMYIKKHFLSTMKKVASQIRQESNIIDDGLELKYSSEFPEYGFNLTGRIDKIARSKTSGEIVVYDYKTGRKYSKKDVEKKSLQFDIYKMLIEKNKKEDVEDGKYAFLKCGSFLDGWPDGKEDFKSALDRLSLASDGIKDGLMEKTDDWNRCIGCEFKGICRRRMNIQ